MCRSSNDMSFGAFLFWAAILLGGFSYIMINEGYKTCTSSPEELANQLKNGGCKAYKDYFVDKGKNYFVDKENK